jgi:tetratricopeptide (TPR) repeat protein
MRALFVILLAAVTAGTVHPERHDQQATSSSRYLDLVQRYRAGEWVATVTELAQWDPDHVRGEARILSLLVSPLHLATELRDNWNERIALIQGIALMHTEVLVRHGWGQVHFDQAWKALDALRKWPQARPFVQSEHIVLASRLLSLFNAPEAQRLLGYATRTGEVVLALGSASESAAVRQARIAPEQMLPISASGGGRLEHAGRLYEEALRLDPTLAEARVRLGRVLVARAFAGDAVAHLERARREAPEGFLGYLAALFLGAAHEQRRSWDAAAECYRAALAEYPESQAAYLALGHVLEVSGRADEGWRTVRDMFGDALAPRNPERDPWWVYFDGQAWQTEHRLHQMREMIGR